MKTNNEKRQFLTTKLMRQKVASTKADAYYSGTQGLQFLDPDVARMMNGRLATLNINFARLAVDTLESRIQVAGFASTPGGAPDAVLWELWQASNMDEQSQQAHLDALIYGRAFYLAWVGSDGSPMLSAESPMQCAVHRSASHNSPASQVPELLAEP